MIDLRAFIDDSASDKGDKRFFVAGYIGRADVWEDFSSAWNIELASGIPIAYLKMSEAKAFRGQFEGWTFKQRTRKLIRLNRIIERSQLMSFHASVTRDSSFDRYKRAAPRGLSSPHFICGFAAIAGVARHFARAHEPCQVEFVFDTQAGVDQDMDLFLDELKKGLSKAARRVIAGKPKFADDMKSAPLQAADLLAWHLRRSHEEHGSWMKPGTLDPTCSQHLDCGDLDAALPIWTDFDEQQRGVDGLQRKAQWRVLRESVRAQLAAGFVPPYGTRKKNFVLGMRDRAKRFIWRWRRGR